MQFLKRVYQRQAARLAYRHGITHGQHRAYRRAITAFSWAITAGYPHPAKALVQRGINRLKLQDKAGAITDFNLAITAQQDTKTLSNLPSNLPVAQAYFYRGQLHQQSGEDASARADWAAAMACCPSYSLPYYYRAMSLLNEGDFRCALSDLDAAVEANPVFALAYFQRGMLRRRQGDVPGAIADLTYAVCNDYTLDEAKQALSSLQQKTDNAQLSQVLATPLAKQGLSVNARCKDNCLYVYVHRAAGVGVNYYKLPATIREHIAPLALDNVSHFQLIGRVGEATRPDWDQSYDLYKDRPCPPSHWPFVLSAAVMFPPLAIPASILAARVKRIYSKGKYVEALKASRAARELSLASSIPFAFFLLLSISYTPYSYGNERDAYSVAERLKIVRLLPSERQRRD